MLDLRFRSKLMECRASRESAAVADRADLSESPALLFDLLDDTPAWRARLVEEAVFAAGSRVRVSSAYQVEFPPALLQRHDICGVRRANVLLPLTTRLKRGLFNLDISGSGDGPVHLLPRASIAALEALYLRHLIASGPASDVAPCFPEAVLEAICVQTPAVFRDLFLKRCCGWYDLALSQYLKDGLGLSQLSPADVKPWRERCEQAGRVLAHCLDEPPDRFSASEQLLLAMPRVEPKPTTREEIDRIVDDFCRGVVQALAQGDKDFLVALAEYGRRYEVIVEMEVPLGEPATVKLSEDRPLEIDWLGRTSQRFALGDARSAHFEARVEDPSVVIAGRFDVVDLAGKRVGLGSVEEIRESPESLSIYSSESSRPYYVDVKMGLRLATHLYVMTLALVILNGGALAAVLSLNGGDSYVEQVAVLTLPTTLAAAFVLVREETALASRLQKLPRLALGLALLGLAIGVGVELVLHD